MGSWWKKSKSTRLVLDPFDQEYLVWQCFFLWAVDGNTFANQKYRFYRKLHRNIFQNRSPKKGHSSQKPLNGRHQPYIDSTWFPGKFPTSAALRCPETSSGFCVPKCFKEIFPEAGNEVTGNIWGGWFYHYFRDTPPKKTKKTILINISPGRSATTFESMILFWLFPFLVVWRTDRRLEGTVKLMVASHPQKNDWPKDKLSSTTG